MNRFSVNCVELYVAKYVCPDRVAIVVNEPERIDPAITVRVAPTTIT